MNRVVVVSPDDMGIAQARTKTDKFDARALASLLWKGELEAVWVPDERARVLRRRLGRREQLVHARSRVKNEVHATLDAPAAGQAALLGSVWGQGPQVAADAGSGICPSMRPRRSRSALRHIEFLDREIEDVEQLDRQAAAHLAGGQRLYDRAGGEPDRRRAFLAAVGDVKRFQNSKRVVAYLGLDPRVRQSGEQAARSGSISKRGSVSARWALVEATWSVVHHPGPLRAFYLRVRSRRGHGKAIVATARKLAVLFWCMLTREQDYAHQQPSLTAKKLRRLEITAGAPVRKGQPSGVWVTHQRMRHAEKHLAAQAQASYERAVRD